MSELLYDIVRFYHADSKAEQVRRRRVTLETAQTHCRDPRTMGPGWFDGYRATRKAGKS